MAAERDPQTGQFTKSAEDVYMETIQARQVAQARQAVAEEAAAQEAATQGEVQPETPQAPAQSEGPKVLSLEEYGEHLIEIKVDGQTRQVPLKKVRDGLMFQEVFTARRQEDKEWEERLAAKEAELQRQAGAALSAQGAGRPQAGFGASAWSGPIGAPTGSGAWDVNSASRPAYTEQPNAGITTRPPAGMMMAPDGDELQQALAPFHQEIMALRGDYQVLQNQLAQQRFEQQQNERIAALGKKYPGFDRDAVEADILALPPQEYADLKANMTPAMVYQHMWLRRQATAVAGPEKATTPHVEPPSRQVATPPPKLPPLMGNSEQEGAAWYAEQLRRKGAKVPK